MLSSGRLLLGSNSCQGVQQILWKAVEVVPTIRMNPNRCLHILNRMTLKCEPEVNVFVLPRLGKHLTKRCSTQAKQEQHENQQLYRTNVNNPREHTEEQLGRIYTVDPEVPRLFGEELNVKQNEDAINYFAPREWVARNELFGETGIMVREPALELINCINNADLSKPAVRYVVYGKHGVGKSTTLAHLTHYGRQEGFVVITFAQIKKWLTRYYEVAPSTYHPGQVDHIVNSNILLKNFRQANHDRLDKCVTHKDYAWSARDKIPAGSPLMEVVDLGCERLAFAADALNVVIKELKENCNSDNCKLMVVCDGVNALFADYTMVHREKRFWENGPYKAKGKWLKNVVQVDECSNLRNIKKLFRNDYKNGVIITSVDRNARVIKTDPANTWWQSQERDMRPETASHLPFALLRQTGSELMAPFYPIEVKPFSEAEMDNMIDYYIEKRWIKPDCGASSGRKEIHFLTGRNPGDFFSFSAEF